MTEAFTAQLPTRGRKIKFTPERIQQIKNLVERGKSRDEIDEMIGVTVRALQVTCSRLGSSLRRVGFDSGMGLLRRGAPQSNNRTSTYTPGRCGGVPLPPINEQPQQNSQSGSAEQHHQERAIKNEVGVAKLALMMQYRGDDRTTQLPLTQDMIWQLALEAQFRDMSIGELVGELIIVIMKKDLFQHVLLEPNSKQP